MCALLDLASRGADSRLVEAPCAAAPAMQPSEYWALAAVSSSDLQCVDCHPGRSAAREATRLPFESSRSRVWAATPRCPRAEAIQGLQQR